MRFFVKKTLSIIVPLCLVLGFKIKHNGTYFSISKESLSKADSIALAAILKTKNDSLLKLKFITFMNKDFKKYENGRNIQAYTEAKILYSNDKSFKVINLYGEYSGGATYNPFCKNYIIKNRVLVSSSVEGEIFRIDKLSDNNYLFYTDDYGRLGSRFSFYTGSFQNNTLTTKPTTQYGNFYFDLIKNKKENFTSTNTIRFKKRFGDEELTTLKLDTLSIELNEYYKLEDSPFLTKELNDFRFIVFYRHKYGDETSKILRIENQNNTKDILLAMRGGDSDSYSVATEFINDSIFVETKIYTETTKDETHLMEYTTDSTITTFRYDSLFNFKELKKTIFNYKKTYKQ